MTGQSHVTQSMSHFRRCSSVNQLFEVDLTWQLFQFKLKPREGLLPL